VLLVGPVVAGSALMPIFFRGTAGCAFAWWKIGFAQKSLHV